MIEIRNRRIYHGLSFEQYLALPGFSYSTIKGSKIMPTPKMQLGTAVHNYLLTPREYEHGHNLPAMLAKKLKEVLGPLLPFVKPELAVTCDMVYEGMVMRYKGRIDLAVIVDTPGLNLVVDIKVSGMDIRKAIDFFGYHHQLNGYSLGIDAPRRVIVKVNPEEFKKRRDCIQVQPIATDMRFWEKSILQLGQPLKQLS